MLEQCAHLGKGYGVIAPDPSGLTRLTFRDCTFEHVGSGSAGDGVQLNCMTFGASFVDVIGCTARNYIGEASSKGMGFGFAGVTDGRLIGCRALDCQGDGFHLEKGVAPLALRRPGRRGRRRREPSRRQRFRADRLRQR